MNIQKTSHPSCCKRNTLVWLWLIQCDTTEDSLQVLMHGEPKNQLLLNMCICFRRFSCHVFCSVLLYEFHSYSLWAGLFALTNTLWSPVVLIVQVRNSSTKKHEDEIHRGPHPKDISPGRESPKVYMSCWTESLLEPMCRKSKAWRCSRIQVSWTWSVWVQTESWGNRGTDPAWCSADSRAQLSPVQQWNGRQSFVLKPEQPLDLRIQVSLCSSTLILNRRQHYLCGGIVFKANCLCFLLIYKVIMCQEFKAVYTEIVNPHMGHES